MAEVAWRGNLVEDPAEAGQILRAARRIAVLGIKPESRAAQPAYFVPHYLQQAGYEVIPVPVYYPEVVRILGQPVYRSLVAVPGEVDLLNVFRRPAHIPAHLDDILAKAPRAVWFQLGIRHDEVAERLARAGIRVVQDRCTMVDHRRFVA
jgi:uncharacterized protein